MKVISQAPTRLGLFGGGTDTNPYALIHGGTCINMAINIRQHIELNNNEDFPNIPSNASKEFYDAFFSEFDFYYDKFNATFDAVIESGLGSSASAAVALIGAILKAQKKEWTSNEIAEKAWDIEVNKLGLFGGKQDQYASVYGGLNLWKFGNDVTRQPFPRNVANSLSKRILLFYTGANRKNTKIQEKMKNLTPERKEALDKIKQSANEAYHKIYQGDYKKLGSLLNTAWHHKKESNPNMTNKRIDEVYDTAINSGAWGGKLSGSGGGGFCFFLVAGSKQDRVINKMESIGCTHYDFSPDFQGLEVRKLP